jgi:hypothetical protein
MQHPFVYLCSAYTHPDPEVRQQRFEAACRAAAELMRSGKSVYSPIVSSHPLCHYGLPIHWSFWQRHDLAFLALCGEVIVLRLDRWEQSIGVQAEIAAARTLGKPVSFLDVTDAAERDIEGIDT